MQTPDSVSTQRAMFPTIHSTLPILAFLLFALMAPIALADVVINEVDADQVSTDSAEFIELYDGGTGGTDLTGLSLVLYNGSDDLSYIAFDLDGESTDGDGYFVLCGNAATVANCDLDVSPDTNLIQNGADAVVLLVGDAVNYPNDTSLPPDGDIIDAIVYDTNDSDDAGVLVLLNAGQPQVNEGGGGDQTGHSNQRCANGTGGARNTNTYGQFTPTPGAINCVAPPPPPFGSCGDPATFIYEVQGNGMSSPIDGTAGITIEGVVVGDFQGSNELRGFFLQEEDSETDADPATSDGIFVFDNGFGPDVDMGDVVRVQGTVDEFFNLTELTSIIAMTDCNATDTASAAVITLPHLSVDDWESTEGMAITFPQMLYATGNFTQARFGEVDLSVGGPLDNPTNVVAPGAPAITEQAVNDVSRIQLDDGSNVQNPLPLPPYLGVDGTLRTGDSVSGLTGALGYAFGTYELHPTSPVSFVRENDRPVGAPDVGDALLKVAGFNVLNYFTTLDNSGPICGPFGTAGCRGADSVAEFDRQKAKLVAALTTLDADVVGLVELENAVGDIPIANLVDGLNTVAGPGTFAYIPTGSIGTDAIRVGIIYKPSAVSPLGGFETLDSIDDPTFNDDLNRPALAQTFEENSTGERFTIAVNHLKSKGSNCNGVGDPDTGDGQGNCNLVRTAAAIALVNWLATDPTGSGDADFLIMGDLNAYAMEDPVVMIEGSGYIDLMKLFVGTGFANGAYSFNFFAQSGYLDHALSSPAMASEVSGAAFWHINSDEPSGLDYNDYNQPGLFNPDQFRSSDHDAVVLGFLLDEDEDGVWDQIDECPGTVIPEGAAWKELKEKHWALFDDDLIFDTKDKKGKKSKKSKKSKKGKPSDPPWDTFDTGGCSCEQIIEEKHRDHNHKPGHLMKKIKYGCSEGEMKKWIKDLGKP